MMPSVHLFSNLDTVAGKLRGGTLVYKNRKSVTKIQIGFGLGTPLPLETSAVLSQIGDEEKRDESGEIEKLRCRVAELLAIGY